MRLIIFFILLLYRAYSVFSQVSTGIDSQTNISQLGTNDPTQVVRQFDQQYLGIKGSPYLLVSCQFDIDV